jgi:hypothetical protein
MKALNRSYATLAGMVFVYLENALNISIYHPVFTYNGGNMDELKMEVAKFLNMPAQKKLRIDAFDRRMGSTGRKYLRTLPQDITDVYVVLKIEDGDK